MGSLASARSSHFLKNKRVLVTGAAGFIGSHLLKALLESGSKPVIVVKKSTDLWRIKKIIGRVEVHKKDLKEIEPEKFSGKLGKIEIIYHLGAAGVNPENYDQRALLETNVSGTWRLLELGRLLGVKRFVYCGSCFEYPGGSLLSENSALSPVSEYGLSKLSGWMLAELYWKKYGLPAVALRPFQVYGPLEAAYRLIPYVILSVLSKKNIKVTAGEQTRDFIFIEDVIKAFIACASAPAVEGEVFNVATSRDVSVKNLVSLVLKIMGSDMKPVYGARPYRPNNILSLSGNPQKAKAKLAWYAETPLEDGLRKTIQWFTENRKLYKAYGA